MADNEADKHAAQGDAGAAAPEKRNVDGAPVASRPKRPERVLKRVELEALRARLQKKFH
jgi:hypothetical protein